MAKRTRAQRAAAGTRADALRTAPAEGASVREASTGAETKSWHVPALDVHSLSARERLTRRMFTTVQVVLCLVLVGTAAALSLDGGGLTSEGLQALFAQKPGAAVSLLAACAQPFVAYLTRIVYRRYADGDAAYAVANLIGLLCAEMLLQSMVGIVAMAVLLWRTWRRGSQTLGAWRTARGLGGVAADISGTLAVIALGAICLFASMQVTA